MRIKQIDYDAPGVIVLGAGATRGASFVSELTGPLPPLDGDFFTQAQRLSSAKPSGLVQELIQNTTSIFGYNFDLTMEGFFTQIEQLSNVFENYKLQGRPGGNPYTPMRQQFLQTLAAVLDEAVGRNHECAFHAALVRQLGAKDTIISFNYDWLIDQTLRAVGAKFWNPHNGYGVPAYHDEGARFWAGKDKHDKRHFPPSTLTLLKMHGSLAWFPPKKREKESDIRLKLRQRWWHQQGNLKFEIVPPEWNKRMSGIYRRIWQKARSQLRNTEAMAFIGYSLPNTDLPAQALLRVDSGGRGKAKPLKLLAIANPDQSARRRIRQVLLDRIDAETRVLTFDSFKEFATFLDPTVKTIR